MFFIYSLYEGHIKTVLKTFDFAFIISFCFLCIDFIVLPLSQPQFQSQVMKIHNKNSNYNCIIVSFQ